MRNRRVVAAATLIAAALAGCDEPAGPETPPGSPPVASVQITESEVTIPVRGDRQLTAVLKAADGRVLTGRQVVWSVSDTAKASISATGRVTGRSAGTATITATSEGKSGQAELTVANPVPVLVSLSPATATAGGPGFTLTVTGSDFAPGARVRWNGASRMPTHLTETEMSVEILWIDITEPDSVEVIVVNPGPGGGISNALIFPVTPAPQAENPVPAVTNAFPGVIDTRFPETTVTVEGSGFVPGSVVRVNGADRPTAFIGHGTLRATLTAGDVAVPRTLALTVFNPPPGGGQSEAWPIQIRTCCFDLLYDGAVDGRRELLRLPMHTIWTEPLRVLAGVEARDPAPSPDGRKVAFVATYAGRSDIYVVDLSTGQTIRLTDDETLDDQPAWSPTGQQIAYRRQSEGRSAIWVATDLSSMGPWLHSRLSPEGGDEERPAWSPDGNRLAFSSIAGGGADIWTVRRDGGDRRRVTSAAGRETDPTWSPDGLVIAYTHVGAGGATSIRLAASGEGPVWINNPELGPGRLPSWSPGGESIAFTTDESGREEIGLMRPDGSERSVFQVWNGGSNPAWIRIPN